jgi:hypothetical protein
MVQTSPRPFFVTSLVTHWLYDTVPYNPVNTHPYKNFAMSLTEVFRSAIRDSGKSVNAIAKESGVAQPMLTRFLNGQDLRLSTADKMAAYFKLSLQPDGPASKKTAKKKSKS